MASKIIVIDDEIDVAKAWSKALTIAGHDVEIAHDAKTAIALAEANPFDLAIIDYMMPTMSGIALLHEIRKHHPWIRSIIISGKLDSSISEKEVLAEFKGAVEADLYLHKPVDNARLKEAVIELMKSEDDKNWDSYAKAKATRGKTKRQIRDAEAAVNRNAKRK